MQYQITGGNNRSGYMTKGDVLQLCLMATRQINESENIKIDLIPAVGASHTVVGNIPQLIKETRVNIYP
ncbi:hypothetical protein AUJ68_06695 [Candidatus Woesearchaeota archaeon CG1_02_57_44]|nr:MAG: hypothetical protein AUJ68_06695 [Candidatus Woesearchaeota archaeon CG1_02_57_44]PIN70056.1 MAG: hypothetical protein COV94_02155 [Candidatus Woesearchaeota archaeon CG11_big_fil_rev_8_21_14_0_20_57_5]